MREALNCLPSKLDELYHDTISRIMEQEREYSELVICALSWVTRAKRRLTTRELQTAVSLADTDTCMDEESLVDITLIQSVCGGLLAIDAASKTFGLVHFTVEEFFLNNGVTELPDADLHVAKGCLTFLCF